MAGFEVWPTYPKNVPLWLLLGCCLLVEVGGGRAGFHSCAVTAGPLLHQPLPLPSHRLLPDSFNKTSKELMANLEVGFKLEMMPACMPACAVHRH